MASSTSHVELDPAPILKYLALSHDYKPSPTDAPVEFLSQHIRYLPPHLLRLFSTTTTPKERTVIPAIRNRRLRYTESSPSELSFQAARTTWPSLWQWQEIQSQVQAEEKEEQEWADKEFLQGIEKQVGKLGALLGEYQAEREAERVREVRRRQREYEEALPEEDEDTDEEEAAKAAAAEEMTAEEAQSLFMRRVKEKYIYGLLDSIDYDKVDWDEKWDQGLDRDDEERWFDEEEESVVPRGDADTGDCSPSSLSTNMSASTTFKLNTGATIPAIGLGTWAGFTHEEQEAAKDWIAGYRRIDTAYLYGTERSVGRAIKESGIPREEIFITTKLPWHHWGREEESIQRSLDSLGVDYVDLWLMHWPQTMVYENDNPFPLTADGKLITAEYPFEKIWAAMEKVYDSGRAKAIGVSNFSIKTLEELRKVSRITPADNQVEMHPYLIQKELLNYCKEKGISVTAYAPTGYKMVREDPLIVGLAEKYKVKPTQIILAWHLARGVGVVPGSKNPEHQKENINLPTLSPEDVKRISGLDKGQRLSNKPDENGGIMYKNGCNISQFMRAKPGRFCIEYRNQRTLTVSRDHRLRRQLPSHSGSSASKIGLAKYLTASHRVYFGCGSIVTAATLPIQKAWRFLTHEDQSHGLCDGACSVEQDVFAIGANAHCAHSDLPSLHGGYSCSVDTAGFWHSWTDTGLISGVVSHIRSSGISGGGGANPSRIALLGAYEGSDRGITMNIYNKLQNYTARLDRLYLAKIADQAERYHDVVAEIKSLITSPEDQLTFEERNLLSIAFKNITGTLRNNWRVIDTLEKREAPRSTPHQVALMHLQKERIRRELDSTCQDIVSLLENYLLKSATAGEERVFYSKMRGDYYRYLAEFTKDQPDDENASSSLDAYKYAYKHAVVALDPMHPTRLGLALNFAVYYHDIHNSPEHACFLAKHAFDEAVMAATSAPPGQILEDSLTILQLLKDDMILWSGEIQ
ncbi:hypothetical protein NM688_g2181 [Phlebia brevispora]|uniref:Uncharacterized protein n=1 Tax=Phlebia brevispora TaxID=194682 RepID=A0ACC1T9E3_9APHY|nr:hypothetical protein NM688_g2181 [Phlebia brevispora]